MWRTRTIAEFIVALWWVAGWGCAEVLDFGDVCVSPVSLVDVNVLASDPTATAASCDSREQMRGMTAGVVVQGAPGAELGSELAVDAESYSATGVVPAVSVGIVRTVVVTQRAAGQPDVVLAYRVAAVDLARPLCEAVLDFDLDGGVTVSTPAQMQALLAGDHDPAVDAAWLGTQVTSEALDHDGDGSSNLAEACAGTLDEPQDP